MALERVCLLCLLASGVITLKCDRIVQNQENENKRSRELLKEMGKPELPQECPYEIPNFVFPMKKLLRSSKEDGRTAMMFILEQISKIFQQNFTQADWNVRVTAQLQEALYQQSVQWKRCCTAATGKEASFKDPRVKLSLLAYFRRIHTYLKDKKYSLCAWEAVRQETWKSCFVGLDQLLNKLQD
ncbi:interferon beta-like [Tiliqua scincoides]|uniref:interferon beta-like n=1 Tax=Tiliqua scincoides TaxID=71010 RepID=UPI0034617EC9